MLENLIEEMNLFKVQKVIAVLLTAELLNQKTLFLAGGGTLDQYESDIDFNVATGVFYSSNSSDYPLVNCWTESFDPDIDDVSVLASDSKLNFDLFAFRRDEKKQIEGETIIIDGTQGADKRLNYLCSQVWAILEAQSNFWKGAPDIISSCNFLSFKKLEPNSENKQVPVSFGRLSFTVKTEEIKEELEGFDVEAFIFNITANNKPLKQLLINII